ncbi:symmetrical bis(5'-nucleosyl)-tetraphosphatase [Shewanella psychrotolerans]|uniref:symmetrical bis(5'-nucleosyl)-tetraphosphatase n=1 Tax=Shewanella psychrotolerans TaxID=2864206 RepID=UPI001C6571D7|nr:symmetrical bis(5'-nucleosyl)-tetraphosphatase [Shewanella psychrotolerans]QYK02161.1 symmetrical bis(5'-nucleosyl)-tetraphosphatase [Shewanella psychrotolerans]
MATYFIGDIQGCYDELQAILSQVDFNPSKDELWIVGDMVARGNKSLQTIRYIKSLEGSAKPVLGNHDLHLMALHGKLKRPKPSDQLTSLLNADDIGELVDWLRLQPLLRCHPSKAIVMTHAGIPPQWDIDTVITEANAVHQALINPNYLTYLIADMYTNDIARWTDSMPNKARLIYCINALTRMRYLNADGSLDFDCKLPPESNPDNTLKPWFQFPSMTSNTHTLVFGHWAALMGKVDHPSLQALDTGCCWGEHLTLWHLESNQKITQKKLEKS